jgi:GT2 family glycosyltransferase/Flp pilus assembly protein TadD
VWGIEPVEHAARDARTKLDRVITSKAEDALAELPDGYFDVMVCADVLEHMQDPAAFLAQARNKLSLRGEVVASIPNVRHWSVLVDLLEGRWDYQDAGILDRTHLRFFTRKSILELFGNAGLVVTGLGATTIEGRTVPDSVVQALTQAGLDTSTLQEESRYYQYLVKASASFLVKGLVSIVIDTSNQLDTTKACIESLRRHTPEAHEILLLYPGASEGTSEWLTELVRDNPSYRLIGTQREFGTARAKNLGIRAARGEYVILLDPDVMVSESWLTGLLGCMDSDPASGMVGPTTTPGTLPECSDPGDPGLSDLDAAAAAYRTRHRYLRIPCQKLQGSCLLFRRSLVDRIGLLDEALGDDHGAEEDYCLRAELEGFQNLVAGDVLVHRQPDTGTDKNRIGSGETSGTGGSACQRKWSQISQQSELGQKLRVLEALAQSSDAFQKGELRHAVDLLLEGMRCAPGDRRLYHRMAEALIESKHHQDALGVLSKTPEGTEPWGLVLRGHALEGLSRFDEAVECAQAALRIRPNHAPAIDLLGTIAFYREEQEVAADHFRQALQCDPGYAEAWTNLGVVLWGLGEQAEALTHLTKGFELAPAKSDLANAYYTAACAAGQYGQVEQRLQEARLRCPLSRTLALLSVDLLFKQERFEVAMAAAQTLLLEFGVDDELLAGATEVRHRIGPKQLESQTQRPSLSVCLVVRDAEQALPRCLDSVSSVSDELIVVDLGSSDRTAAVAEVFGAKVLQGSGGSGASDLEHHAKAVAQAKGDWILLMNADEALSPRDHEPLVALLKGPRTKAYALTSRIYVDHAPALVATADRAADASSVEWVASVRVRLFPNTPDILSAHGVQDPTESSLRELGLVVEPCDIAIHRYGRLHRGAGGKIDGDAPDGQV